MAASTITVYISLESFIILVPYLISAPAFEILEETPYNHYKQDANWKGGDDGHTLEAVEGVPRKKQGDGEEYQHHAPEAPDSP